MAKQYKGSLTLEWFNKQKAILFRDETAPAGKHDVPAPRINWINKDEAEGKAKPGKLFPDITIRLTGFDESVKPLTITDDNCEVVGVELNFF